MKTAFFWTTQFFLVFSAVGKMVGAAKWTPGLRLTDPLVTFLTARQILVSASVIELCVVVFLWRQKADIKKGVAVLWLGFVFLAYRLGLWTVGFKGYCHCLGYWSSWLHIPEARVNTIALWMLAFMLSGAGLITIRQLLWPDKSITHVVGSSSIWARTGGRREG